MKKLGYLLGLLAILLTNVMVGIVAYTYGEMKWAMDRMGYSSPASVAFLYGIPFLIVIAACIAGAVYCRKKSKK